MRLFRKKKHTLRDDGKEAFRLHTGDISDHQPFFSATAKREALARLLAAGGTHDTRNETDAFFYRRSWNRFSAILILLILIWLLAFFIP